MLPFVNNLMPFRYQHLQWTLEGLRKTGIPLIEYHDNKFYPSGVSDDSGIYYFVPKIANLFNLDLDTAISIFFSSLFVISIAIAIFSFLKLCKKISYRFIGFFYLLILSFYIILRGDIYILFAVVPLMVIPIIYYFHKIKNFYYLYFTYIFTGLIIAFSNFIRSNSSTSVIIFLIIFLFFEYKNIKNKSIYLITLLFIGIIIGNLIINSIKDQRDEFLLANNVDTNYVEGHVFWHQVYIGLGFLNNDYGITYNDDCAFQFVRFKNKNINLYSPEYEQLLKNELIKLIKNDPWFIIKTIFAKLGVILFYVLFFVNISIIFIVKLFKNYSLFIPLFSGLLFNLLFPLLAMPFPSYLLGVVTFSILLTLFSLINNHIFFNNRFNINTFLRS